MSIGSGSGSGGCSGAVVLLSVAVLVVARTPKLALLPDLALLLLKLLVRRGILTLEISQKNPGDAGGAIDSRSRGFVGDSASVAFGEPTDGT